MTHHQVCRCPAGAGYDVDVEEVTAAFGTVDIVARGRAAAAVCPDCGRFSDRVHDSYQRGLKDLPLAGRALSSV